MKDGPVDLGGTTKKKAESPNGKQTCPLTFHTREILQDY